VACRGLGLKGGGFNGMCNAPLDIDGQWWEVLFDHLRMVEEGMDAQRLGRFRCALAWEYAIAFLRSKERSRSAAIRCCCC